MFSQSRGQGRLLPHFYTCAYKEQYAQGSKNLLKLKQKIKVASPNFKQNKVDIVTTIRRACPRQWRQKLVRLRVCSVLTHMYSASARAASNIVDYKSGYRSLREGVQKVPTVFAL